MINKINKLPKSEFTKRNINLPPKHQCTTENINLPSKYNEYFTT